MTKVKLTPWAYERLLLRASHDAKDVMLLLKEASGINDIPHIKGVTVLDTELGDPLVDFLVMKEDGNIILDVRMRYSRGAMSYALGSSSISIRNMPQALAAGYAARVPFQIEELIENHPCPDLQQAQINKVIQHGDMVTFSAGQNMREKLVEDYPDNEEDWEITAMERKRA